MSRQNKASTLTVAAYEQIRDGILDGTFAAGAPLTRRRLSETFQMSLVPVAQALQRLESEGLVESLPRVGTRVKIPKADEVRGHYVVREALEAQVARLFAKNATAVQRRQLIWEAAKLDNLFARYFESGADKSHSWQVNHQHLQFHLRLAEATGCAVLIQQIQNSQVLLFNWRYTLTRREPLPESWHQQLAEVLANEDIEAADRAMRHHVTFSMEDVIARFEEMLADTPLATASYRGPQRKTAPRENSD